MSKDEALGLIFKPGFPLLKRLLMFQEGVLGWMW